VSDGLANNVDCEPTFSANMWGVGSTITANDPTFGVLRVVSQIFVRMPFRVRYPLSSMTNREGEIMISFKGAHFEKEIILTCVRWVLST
jgi:hypothetical protein